MKIIVKVKILYLRNYKDWSAYQRAINRFVDKGWFNILEVAAGDSDESYAILANDGYIHIG